MIIIFSYPLIKINEKLLHPNVSKIANDPNPSWIEVWITVPSKEPHVTEETVNCEGNMESVVDEGDSKIHV